MFNDKNHVVRALFSMEWCEEDRCLTYVERHDQDDHVDEEQDTSIRGGVYVPPHMALMHFPAIFNGLVRLITVKRPAIPREGMKLYGFLLSQSDPDGAGFFQPATASVLLVKLPGDAALEPKACILPREEPTAAEMIHSMEAQPQKFGHTMI
jgi:hypothetical protein